MQSLTMDLPEIDARVRRDSPNVERARGLRCEWEMAQKKRGQNGSSPSCKGLLPTIRYEQSACVASPCAPELSPYRERYFVC
jgi:hypothetical protein